ncbi:YidB family protein [Streptomyces sp. NBC_01239]|uniref:YidB family protein n=1 Tax=Streptomyces sp. NBC_01239 TaxID=2903792 RepID=UPI00224D7F44|nr:YidB family protein [Streptomyces sp. NBC_01239]MCX4810013.1 YidB family protein [Streptomyces sp. NBC_01239]
MAGNDLGSLLGGLLGGSGGGSQGGSGSGNILGALLSALGGSQSGGSGGSGGGSNPLGGLLDMLTKSGLTEQKDSWVGTGQNQSVTGAQIQQALPDDTLQKVAEQAGVTPEQAASDLAQTLPQAVDRLTPQGQVPQAASLEELVRQQSL